MRSVRQRNHCGRALGQKTIVWRNTVTSITRWDPFAELRSSMDRLFDDGLTRPWRTAPRALEYQAGFPVEVSETSDGIEVKALLPGIRPEEVDITVSNGVLTIKAEHR